MLEKIVGKCPSCGILTEFDYLGIQRTLDEDLILYDCQQCGSTISFNSILDANPKGIRCFYDNRKV